MANKMWFTNLEHGKRHTPLNLMTMEDNLIYSHHKDVKGKESYLHYDNYDAIEVPHTDSIPSDYEGIMGVPITFLDRYCPEQFEIVGISIIDAVKKPDYPLEKRLQGGPAFYVTEDGIHKRLHARIIIRKRKGFVYQTGTIY